MYFIYNNEKQIKGVVGTVQLLDNVLEIRYKPNPKFLDSKGRFAKIVLEELQFDHWSINENGFEVNNEDVSERAFLSFNRFGYVVKDSQTNNYFFDKCSKFIKAICNDEIVQKNIYVERIGLRQRKCAEFKGNFETLMDKYNNKMIQSNFICSALQSEMIDTGCNLNFKDKYGTFNTVSGPMEKEQILEFFFNQEKNRYTKTKDNVPDVGLYIDLDYWTKPEREISRDEIIRNLKVFAEQAIYKCESFCKFILEE